jgi:MoaA/NifB/PqqE/SkfB family radical SAM enzyme
MPFQPGRGLPSAFLAITRRCALGCAHCSEWDTLRQPDTLSVGDLLEIVARMLAAGVPQIQISGGEPLLRLDAVEAICRSARDACDLWVLTSGAPLTAELAQRLRAAGATGVMVSLDHWDSTEHDAFRGIPGTFDRAVMGTRHAAAAGLVVALSLTATRGFISADNLERYAALAQRLGAGFIQVLEPRAVGRWAGADVALTNEQVALLEAFDHSMNQERPEMPLVDYPGLGQRRDGCWGAGDRYLFVDADGGLHACPFCRGTVGSCLVESLEALRDRLRVRGCHEYHPAGGDAAR